MENSPGKYYLLHDTPADGVTTIMLDGLDFNEQPRITFTVNKAADQMSIEWSDYGIRDSKLYKRFSNAMTYESAGGKLLEFLDKNMKDHFDDFYFADGFAACGSNGCIVGCRIEHGEVLADIIALHLRQVMLGLVNCAEA